MNITADICIPTYNEEKVVEESVKELAQALKGIPEVSWRIIVADNGSIDATAERAARLEGVKVIHIQEKGKGIAVIATARESSANLFGFTDVDLSADPRDFKELVGAINQGADIAIGSRFLNINLVHRSFVRHFSSAMFNVLRKWLIGISVQDTQCGLKLMNKKGRNILAQCKEEGWFFDMELLARAEQAGCVVKEVPIHWEEYRFMQRPSKLRLFSDSIGAVQAMLRIRKRLRAEQI